MLTRTEGLAEATSEVRDFLAEFLALGIEEYGAAGANWTAATRSLRPVTGWVSPEPRG